MATQIEINIDNIVFHGLAPEQCQAVNRSIKTELSRLFTDNPIDAKTGNNDIASVVSSKKVNINQGSSNESIGQQVAQSIYKGITE